MTGRLLDKRVLVTHAEDFMGPVTVEVFREEGAEVIADSRPPGPARLPWNKRPESLALI